ncbi:hypothetical protein AABB24_002057 [Solanum stoloniferum]|uniref:Uncharacterized protein n=1 Tax=Solanum stoloniferum TaxID=62892 RepID=A0ABD2VMU9_9SOLN
MAISLCFSPLTSTPKHYSRIPLYKPINPITTLTTPKILNPNFKKVNCVPKNSQNLSVIQEKPRWKNWVSIAESLYPVYVTVGGVVACLKPSTFSWFVKCAPTSYSLGLWFIMLAMGLTLEIKELTNLLLQKPLSESKIRCKEETTTIRGCMFGKRKMKKQNRWISNGTRSRKIFKGIFVI